MNNAQGSEQDRYLTLYGESNLPLKGLIPFGDNTKVRIVDGHLRLISQRGRGGALIDTSKLHNARLTMTVVKTRADRIGALALAGADGSGGLEAVLTERSSTDGQMYLAGTEGGSRTVHDRSWFNIGNDIEYKLCLTVKNGDVTVQWKNMPGLSARTRPQQKGLFGFFVENGGIFVTGIRLEKLS